MEKTTTISYETVNIYRSMLVKDTEIEYENKETLNMAYKAANVFRDLIEKRGQSDREQLMVLLLSPAHKFVGVVIAHVGTINSCSVHPREIIAAAISGNASSIIIGHNHPSGEIKQSKDDIEVTKKLIFAGKIMSVNVLDHIIIGEEGHLSLCESNLLDFGDCSNEAEKTINNYMAKLKDL
jgi:DNA repair protein RadC